MYLPSSPEPQVIALDPSIEDWSHSTQEALDTLPQDWSRTALYVIIALGVVALPWSMLTKIDEVGTARGRLEPKGKPMRLDAAVSGSVAAVKAQEGQQVKAGQPVLELNSEIVRVELLQSQTKLDGLFNRIAQLRAIQAQLQSTAQIQQQQRQTQAQEQVAQLDQTQQQLGFHQASSELSQTLLAKEQSQVDRFRKFQAMGIIPGIQVEQAERSMIEAQQRLQQARSEIQQAQSELQKQHNSYERIVRQADLVVRETQRQEKELQAQIAETQTEVLQTRNQIKALQYQWQQRSIKAPVDGTIFQLPIQHAGAVVQPGQMVAHIAPKGMPLVLRTQMASGESGFLKVGLPAKVKFDAYPFQDYGIVPGKVRWVSPDSKIVQSGQSQAQVFDVEIELERPYIQAGNKLIALTPGQTANAEVIIRQRRVIDFLLDPFKKLNQDGVTL
jgi:HlyD family secretion protein